jgi:hypothetical protein
LWAWWEIGNAILRRAIASQRNFRMRTDGAYRNTISQFARAPFFLTARLKEQAMSRKQYSLSKQFVVAAALALGTSGVALADDSSMSIWTGDSYAYFNGGKNFPYGKPVFNKGPLSFRQTDPHGLSIDEYQALSSDGRPWQLPNQSDATVIASMDAAKSWRQSHPHGLPISVYEAWSADGRSWQWPNSSATSAVASADATPFSASVASEPSRTGIARLFGLLHAGRSTSAN